MVGVLASQQAADTEVEGLEVINRNNLVISPLNTVMRRFEDNNSFLKDEIDGVYIKVNDGVDSVETAGVVSAILNATHKDAGDYTVVVPAGRLNRSKTLGIFRSDLTVGICPSRRHRTMNISSLSVPERTCKRKRRAMVRVSGYRSPVPQQRSDLDAGGTMGVIFDSSHG